MLLHAHHVYSMTGQRCSVLCYCVGTKKRNGFDVLTLYLPPNLHPTPHRTWRRVVASLLKPGSVFGVVAIGMGSAKLVEKLTRRLSNRTIREMSVESPNPMYGQHGRAMQANEGGMEAAARAVSTSFESKRVEEKGWEGGEKTDARENVGVVEGLELAELGGLELAVIRNTDVSLQTSTPEEEFAFEDGTGGAPVDVQIEIGEGKERAGLSLEGHDTNIITRMQATQRMKQVRRLHEGEHGINV